MPTQRRRIGFLPRKEIQIIIDKICNHNKLSQSKVTGILVEEALISRGILNSSQKKISLDIPSYNNNLLFTDNKILNNARLNEEDKTSLEDNYIKDEVQMINDFIEFKLFKNLMSRYKKES